MPALHSATIKLSEFAWTSLLEEARRQGVSVEELLAHAAMYYLADLDSGRVAARVLPKADEVGPTPRRFRADRPDESV